MYGIPTTYKGINFRSRAEARWAYFFDRLKWPWLYEPIDCAGYIPDFLLTFDNQPVIVEVKGGAVSMGEICKNAGKAKAAAMECEREALILGAAPLCSGKTIGGSAIGVLCGNGLDGFGIAASFWCYKCKKYSITDGLPAEAWCRSCGTREINMSFVCSNESTMRHWACAMNETQWARGANVR